eukprot:CAMPEP_0170370076 /NCGR_PEP_ID=MMETSP0117_2-20130122/8320_1 /TAXON_ID=400756 /ORGANISM="Durinskia baltica, Strain CSIRO CS-38" /LENGTH=149 /DNA_ID=CAMNT_0010624831 /DNA_START=437 /DNA_END=886 /DNA_ORIENTATION=-
MLVMLCWPARQPHHNQVDSAEIEQHIRNYYSTRVSEGVAIPVNDCEMQARTARMLPSARAEYTTGTATTANDDASCGRTGHGTGGVYMDVLTAEVVCDNDESESSTTSSSNSFTSQHYRPAVPSHRTRGQYFPTFAVAPEEKEGSCENV